MGQEHEGCPREDASSLLPVLLYHPNLFQNPFPVICTQVTNKARKYQDYIISFQRCLPHNYLHAERRMCKQINISNYKQIHTSIYLKIESEKIIELTHIQSQNRVHQMEAQRYIPQLQTAQTEDVICCVSDHLTSNPAHNPQLNHFSSSKFSYQERFQIILLNVLLHSINNKENQTMARKK